MKKSLPPVLAVLFLLFAGLAFAASSGGVPLYKAEKVAKEFDDNEFSADKKYNKGPVAVAGSVNRVGMGQYIREKNLLKSQKCPEISLKGRFSAYLMDGTKADLAEIEPGDYVVLLCDSLELSFGSTQGKCRIAMFGPLLDGKIQPRWEDEETFRVIDGE